MAELGLPVTPPQVVRHYAGWIDGFVLDNRDEDYADQIDMPVLVTDTLMLSLADRERLASETLKFAATLTRKRTLA
jgi:LPPG:FO 2-phospho-L-lactate transferase